jgi:hypothetical protein
MKYNNPAIYYPNWRLLRVKAIKINPGQQA